MSKWDNLPNEILAQIVKTLGDHDSNTKWMFVNTQWFDMYQSIVYKKITINLGSSEDKALGTIINSKFHPGRWVQSITFHSLTFLSSLNTLTLIKDEDPLRQLMLCCPQVEKFVLPSAKLKYKEWYYFYNALVETNIWKLHFLVIDEKDKLKLNYGEYYKCTYFLKGYIRELKLYYGMITSSGGEIYTTCLQGFKNLTTLEIGENVVKDMHDCCKLLQNLSQLEELVVTFSTLNHNDDIQQEVEPFTNYDKENLPITHNYYPKNMKRICLVNYAPSRDDDISLIIKNFVKLEYLKIDFLSLRKVGPFMMKLLFAFMWWSIPAYRTCCSGEDNLQFLKLYYDSMKNNLEEQERHTFCLTISQQSSNEWGTY